MNDTLVVRQLNQTDYTTVWHAMQNFTDNRNDETVDEVWLVEHPAVFTQGQAGKEEHILCPSNIPVVKVDRGGQVTYHGPGQQVLYILVNLRRRKIGVRQLVTLIEKAIIESLNDYGLTAKAKADAPGVYVNDKKVASLGLRIRKGCSFHGLALNVNMDLSPFLLINPCGYAGLEMVQTSTLGGPNNILEAGESLIKHISTLLNSSTILYKTGLETLNDN